MIVAFNFIIVASSCYYNNASYCNANVDLFEKCNSYDCVLSNYNNIFTSDDLFRYNTLFCYNKLTSTLNIQSEHDLVVKVVYNNFIE